MLSTTGKTTFLANRNSLGAQNHVIVKLTDGTSTWYFSDCPISLTDGFVYDVNLQMSGIQSQADPITKDWSVSDVSLTISNAPYRDDATLGRGVRPSDELSGIVGKDVYIYLASGPVTAISDCLQRFYGQVSSDSNAIAYDADQMTIKCRDKSHAYNKLIPRSFFIDDETLGRPVSPEVSTQPIPLVYGEFTFDKWNPRDGTGLIKGFPLTKEMKRPPFQFAAHALEALSAVYYRENEEPLLWENWSTGVSDADANADAQLDDEYVWAFMMINELSAWSYGFNVSTQTNEAAGVDGSASTSTGIRDFYDNGSERRCSAPYIFAEDQESVFSNAISYNAERGLTTDFDVSYKINESVTHASERKIILYHATGGGGVAALTLSTLTWDGTERSATGSVVATTADDKAERYCLRIYGVTTAAGADSVTENQTLATLYRLGISAKWHFSEDVSSPRQNPPEEEAWAAGQGRAFGSWVDNVGRSNSYASGDLIDNIAGVIESILRDECGVATASIDESSFDAAMDTTTALGADPFIQMLERKPAFDYIKQLVEQCKLLFVWTANSKARLIKLVTPTTVRTIPFSHIVEGDIKISRIAPFANDISAKSRYLEYYSSYMDSGTGSNATSQSAYGVRSYNAEWPNIHGTQASLLIDALMGISGSTGLWAQPHNIIELETVGFTNADIEVGDGIELEAASCDGQVKLFGESWSGKQFMVTSVEQCQYTTKLTAIKL